MLSKYILLSVLFLSLGLMAEAKSTLSYPTNSPNNIFIKTEPKINLNSELLSYAVCSCTSYYGIPHTCYYSPTYDSDYSCYSKCVREANQ